MSHATFVAKALGEHPVTKQFDLIGFDPRGVGASTPALDCFTDAEREADRLVNSLNSGGKDYTEAENRQLYRNCAERSGGEDVLAHVGTRDVVRDMDVLRAVLGDEKLSFLGASYGTRLGAIYAPENVDKLAKGIGEELSLALKEGFAGPEFDSFREGLLLERRIDRAQDESLSHRLADNLYMGRTMAFSGEVDRKLGALTPADVQAVFRKYVDPARFVTVTAGDFAKKKP